MKKSKCEKAADKYWNKDGWVESGQVNFKAGAEALLRYAKSKQFKTDPEEELGVRFNVVMIEYLEQWVKGEK